MPRLKPNTSDSTISISAAPLAITRPLRRNEKSFFVMNTDAVSALKMPSVTNAESRMMFGSPPPRARIACVFHCDDREQRHEDQRLGDDVEAEAEVLHAARRGVARPVVGDPRYDHEHGEHDAPVPPAAERELDERHRDLRDEEVIRHQQVEQAREREDRAEQMQIREADEAHARRHAASRVRVCDLALRLACGMRRIDRLL